MVDINIEIVPQIVFIMANILILFLLMRHFLFRPVMSFLDKRAEAVRSQLSEAEASRAEAAKLAEEYERRLAEAREEARRVIETASKQAERAGSEIEAQAREQAQNLLERAQKEIGLERDKALAAVRDEIGALAVMAAGRLLEEKMDPATDEKLVKNFLEGMGKANG